MQKPPKADEHHTQQYQETSSRKRKARSNWQKSHTPDSRHIYNQASNKLKQALHDMNNASFTE